MAVSCSRASSVSSFRIWACTVASKAVVGSSARWARGGIVFVHLVPNVLSIVIVYLTLTIPAVMLFEAFLSFLGLGIEPPKVSWGLLAVDGYLRRGAHGTFADWLRGAEFALSTGGTPEYVVRHTVTAIPQLRFHSTHSGIIILR